MELSEDFKTWSKYAKVYDPIRCASIDGTDCEPHDRAVIRACNSIYKPNKFVKGRPECTIFVSRLNHDTSKETIKEIFSKYGKLKRFRMVKDVVTGMPKGYAFVEYEVEQAAEEAYRLANKMVVDGNTIFVDFECERLLKGWKPRRLGGGFAGKKESGQLRFGGRDRPFKKPIALELKEQEYRKQREKERRLRENRRRRDGSRDRIRRKSLPKENDSTSRSDSREKASPREKVKRPHTPERKPSKLSPPEKSSRRDTPLRESEKLARKRETFTTDRRRRSPSREKARPKSPFEEHNSQVTIHNNKNNYKDISKQKSPDSSEQIKKSVADPFKEEIRSSREKAKTNYSPFNENRHQSSKKYGDSPGKSERRSSSSPGRSRRMFSTSKQNGRHHPPSEQYTRRRSRSRDRRRSPFLEESNGKYSADRRDDIRPLLKNERQRLHSSSSHEKVNHSYENDDYRFDRTRMRESPERKQRSYPTEREMDRKRRPFQSPERFTSGRDQHSYATRRSPTSFHSSPFINDARETIEHVEDVDGHHLTDYSRNYHQIMEDSCHNQNYSSRHENGRHSPHQTVGAMQYNYGSTFPTDNQFPVPPVDFRQPPPAFERPTTDSLSFHSTPLNHDNVKDFPQRHKRSYDDEDSYLSELRQHDPGSFSSQYHKDGLNYSLRKEDDRSRKQFGVDPYEKSRQVRDKDKFPHQREYRRRPNFDQDSHNERPRGDRGGFKRY